MDAPTDGWLPAIAEDDLAQGKPVRVSVGGNDVFLCRTKDRIFALDNRCSHQGGPLHRGQVRLSGTLPTVTCPVHGSIFGLTDGRVLRAPAMAPQPVYDTRVAEGMVEVRPRD
jgi:nitrite reductase/ring-hydroxylating ferredoxin subunit